MFNIRDRGSTVSREVIGGVTTFMAMSYIIFVQVGVLGKTGMDHGGIIMATCIAAGLASILMGIWANYPIALAPGMGENFFFVYTLCGIGTAGAFRLSWQEALALTLIPGVLIVLLTVVGFRKYILDAIPNALKSGIAAGIGLFIAVIGLNYGNIVTGGGALTKLTGFANNPVAMLTILGLAVTATLLAFRVPGAILLGILIAAAVALAPIGNLPDDGLNGAAKSLGQAAGMGKIQWCGSPVGLPTGIEKTAGAFVPGFAGLWGHMTSGHAGAVTMFTLILLFMLLFDTVGTLVGVAHRAGLTTEDGRLPRASQALAADAVGTMAGATLGTSSVTCYIESITGVSSGARTGLSAVVAGVCLLGAMFFGPLIQMIGGGIVIGKDAFGDPIVKFPLIAPALIIVGAMMIRTLREIDFDDVTEYLPAFLTMVTMPLAYSISDGIAVGIVSYAFGKLVTGRFRQCPPIVYLFAALFVAYYVCPRPG